MPSYSRTTTRTLECPTLATEVLASARAHPLFVFGFINDETKVEAFFHFFGEFVDIPLYGARQERVEIELPLASTQAPLPVAL